MKILICLQMIQILNERVVKPNKTLVSLVCKCEIQGRIGSTITGALIILYLIWEVSITPL